MPVKKTNILTKNYKEVSEEVKKPKEDFSKVKDFMPRPRISKEEVEIPEKKIKLKITKKPIMFEEIMPKMKPKMIEKMEIKKK
jgi:hypothetical protein